MSELIASFGSVTGLVLGLLFGVVWMWIAPAASRRSRRWLTALVVASLTLSVHDASRLLSWPLRPGSHTFSRADAPSAPYAIVVLGADAKTIHGQSRKLGVLTPTGASRVLEAARVFELLGEPWIVSSGGPAPGRDMIPESEAMQRALIAHRRAG